MTENATLIAPCGMNCGVCLAYLRNNANVPRLPRRRRQQAIVLRQMHHQEL